MPDRPILVCTVGLPRSGKSTWARTQGVPVVNRDAVRLALHGERFLAPAEPMVAVLTLLMVKSLFGAGHRVVIVDETNTTRTRRDFWRSDEWATYWHPFNLSFASCLDRAVADGRDDLIPVIERMHKQFEPLGDDEPLLRQAALPRGAWRTLKFPTPDWTAHAEIP